MPLCAAVSVTVTDNLFNAEIDLTVELNRHVTLCFKTLCTVT